MAALSGSGGGLPAAGSGGDGSAKFKVLVMSSALPDYTPARYYLDCGREIGYIEEEAETFDRQLPEGVPLATLAAAPRLRVAVKTRNGVSLERLRGFADQNKWHVVHFSGHGNFDVAELLPAPGAAARGAGGAGGAAAAAAAAAKRGRGGACLPVLLSRPN